MLITALDMQQLDILITTSCLGDHLVCLLICYFMSQEKRRNLLHFQNMLTSEKKLSRKHWILPVEMPMRKRKVVSFSMTRKLEPGDRVLVRNLSEHGGPGKIQSHWEQDVYIVVKRQCESPVYIVKKENGQGTEKFYIVTYFCSVIFFLLIQYQHPHPKIRNI